MVHKFQKNIIAILFLNLAGHCRKFCYTCFKNTIFEKGGQKTFAILNAGMNDFMRPALYDAVHRIVPLIKNNKKFNGTLEFVGPICETTCKFVKYKNYQKIGESDFVAIIDVGAYGASLSSNYNTKPLIAELLVGKGKTKIIRRKQNLETLINY